jgi:bacterioferritin (cytochrome b1)
MEIAKEGLIPARTLKEILQVNLSEEETAIKLYRSILRAVGQEGEILYETVEEILKDEQEHKEELERLKE